MAKKYDIVKIKVASIATRQNVMCTRISLCFDKEGDVFGDRSLRAGDMTHRSLLPAADNGTMIGGLGVRAIRNQEMKEEKKTN